MRGLGQGKTRTRTSSPAPPRSHPPAARAGNKGGKRGSHHAAQPAAWGQTASYLVDPGQVIFNLPELRFPHQKNGGHTP